MRRDWKKKLGIVMLSAIMVMDTSMIARAAGWTEKTDGWYYEENGDYLKSIWKKSDKGYYYLGETGKLLTDSWVADGDKKYYVDSEGLRVKNQWVNTKSWDDAEDSTEYWYYFNANGEMLTGKQKVKDKKYFFSEEGKMLTGWVTFTNDVAENITDDISIDNTYYCLENGERASGWFELAPPADEDNKGDIDWYNFEGNGKIRRNKKNKVGNYEFCFDTQGRMIDGWAYKTLDNSFVKVDENTEAINDYNNDASRYYYCGAEGVGAVQKNIWLKVVPPAKEGDPDEGDKWYYFDKKGVMAMPDSQSTATPSDATPSDATPSQASRVIQIRKVNTTGEYEVKGGSGELLNVLLRQLNDKYYLFDNKGQMVDGLLYVYNNEGKNPLKEGYYDFGAEGARRTGKAKKEEAGIDYEYYFAKKNGDGYSLGQGVTGIYDGKLYYKGLCVKADDNYEYELVSIPDLAGTKGTGLFVIDENGKVKTSGTTQEFSDGNKYRIKAGKSKKSGYQVFLLEKDGPKEGTLLNADDADLTVHFDQPMFK